MAVIPKSVASWGLLAERGGGSTQVLQGLEVFLQELEPLEVEILAPEISVELDDE